MVEVKFCGLTRPGDAAQAVALGASYAGVIFAGGPRLLSAAQAREVLAPLAGTSLRRVGVFGEQSSEVVADLAHAAAVDVVQLHGGATPDSIARLRALFGGPVWAVLRIPGGRLPPESEAVGAAADAVVLDAVVPGQLGGTGVALAWDEIAPSVSALRSRWPAGRRVVLAGGLRPGNVARAVGLVRPEVVDVSSGVESAPGVKDIEMMRAFAAAARVPIERSDDAGRD